ncbi:MAG TPA: hypothetical protein DCM08_01760 [Microscillaceae bacterium]|nr:hypothetical protein [Microscillaceae bacterium]
MLDKLISEINTIGDFSAADIDHFLGSLTEVLLPKGAHFLTEGQVSKHIGYIVSGITNCAQPKILAYA